MQTLIFNTTEKKITLYEEVRLSSPILLSRENVTTVKYLEGFYEVMQKQSDDSTIPILRLPISNTNMIIQK